MQPKPALSRQPASILAADEPPSHELILGSGRRPIIFVCDHASNRVPRSLGGLGLADHHLEDHIAWDIGAESVARRLARCFDADAVLAGYSRLVVDLNRSLHDAGAFVAISDGILVPGNIGLSMEARGARAREIYHPYHRTIRQRIDARTAAGRTPVFIAIHSFTPRANGVERPCHIGVLWDKDPRLPLPLMRALREDRDIVVADNEPYSGRHPADFTIDHHAEPLGIAHVGIEIRQDLIRDEIGQEQWAARLADALRPVLDQETLYTRLTAVSSPATSRPAREQGVFDTRMTAAASSPSDVNSGNGASSPVATRLTGAAGSSCGGQRRVEHGKPRSSAMVADE